MMGQRVHDSLLEGLQFERGTYDDYAALARFHYKSGRPSPAKAVFRITRSAPTVVGRYLRRDDQKQIVGVLVRSLPHLSCQMRDAATRGRYRGMKRRDAAIALNREVRTISRVVIDPQWRGVGLAVKLVRFALDHPQDTDAADNESPLFTEALAAMGHVSPFFERAGMTRYDRPLRPEDARLTDALRHLAIDPCMLSSPALVNQHCVDSHHAAFLTSELRRWLQARRRAGDAASGMALQDLLIVARDELLSQPVYYLFQHATPSPPEVAANSTCS